ncbi:MAG: hypothetical protein ACFFD1_07240 [Candidatus Thorarchaeota archaeon]
MNVELLAGNDRLKEKSKKINNKEKLLVTKCEFCGKRVARNTWNKKYRLINVCQQPPKRYFCSSQCKLKWIFNNNYDFRSC